MPQQKTYRFVIEIPGTSPRLIKQELAHLLQTGKHNLTPPDAGRYYWHQHIKDYSRVVSRRDPDSKAALSIMLNNTVNNLRKAADDLEKMRETLSGELKVVEGGKR